MRLSYLILLVFSFVASSTTTDGMEDHTRNTKDLPVSNTVFDSKFHSLRGSKSEKNEERAMPPLVAMWNVLQPSHSVEKNTQLSKWAKIFIVLIAVGLIASVTVVPRWVVSNL
ncbi:RxLR effector protein [Phytophthora megakarya]|uniref:RxLR effector protein n=1 Tax=Phytophthora megakarya TaxID=4795 RepID=A0A225UR58_9STRA|nr:RxLR effector protein [Phytophthora megakarya]